MNYLLIKKNTSHSKYIKFYTVNPKVRICQPSTAPGAEGAILQISRRKASQLRPDCKTPMETFCGWKYKAGDFFLEG